MSPSLQPSPLSPRSPLAIERLGMVAFHPMLALQEARHFTVRDANAVETLFLLEHTPTITFGRNAGSKHLLATPAELAARGIALASTNRGGDITFHGPGQLVAYPILRLGEGERDIQAYVFRLEEIILRTLADFGITAERQEGRRGIWVGAEKVAALGVRVARWTTLHGFAINVDVDLTPFQLIVPCGLRDFGVTSMARLLGRSPELRAVEDRLVVHSAAVFNRSPVETDSRSNHEYAAPIAD